MEYNHYGALRVPILGISLEQLILLLYPSFLIPAVFLWYTNLQKRKDAVTKPVGCQRLCPKSRSDHGNSKSGAVDATLENIKVVQIHPVKHCASLEVDDVESAKMWDGVFSFAVYTPQLSVDTRDTRATPQWVVMSPGVPGHENLALVQAEIWLPQESQTNSKGLRVSQTGALVVRFPNIPNGLLAFLDRFLISRGFLPAQSSFQVPLNPPANHEYPRIVVSTPDGNVARLNYEAHIPDDLRQFIGAKHQLSLFRADPASS